MRRFPDVKTLHEHFFQEFVGVFGLDYILIAYFLLQAADDLRGKFKPDVRADERVFQRIEEFAVKIRRGP